MDARRVARRRRAAFDRLEDRRVLTLAMTGASISAAQGQPFSGLVATVFDTKFNQTPASFTSVTINWGDGQTSSGQVVGPLVPGVFEVVGNHTYAVAQARPYTTLISVATADGSNASAIGTALVAAPPFPISVNTLAGPPGTPLPDGGLVATFLSPNPKDNSASDFSAIINWGDGQSTLGSILPGMTGTVGYTVNATHTYAAPGTYTTRVTVASVDGQQATATGQADITAPSNFATTSKYLVIPVSQLFSGIVATFTDSNTSDLASNFTASIAWGDGDTTPATVTGANGSFAVQGMYTYPSAGTDTVTVTVADSSGNTFPVTDTAVVTTTDLSNNAVMFTGGLAAVPGNGPNAASGYTDTDRPTFSGTTVPFSIVQLSARLSGVDATLPLGQAVAGQDGQWSLATGPLVDGIYTITATVTPPAGPSSGMIPLADNGRIVVDTVSPQVIGQSVVGPGRVVVTFRDDLSGMDTATLLNTSNYTFAGPGLTALHPNRVRLLPAGNLPTDARSVLLTNRGRPRLLRHVRALRISGTNDVSVAPNVTVNAGIIDNAGNAVQATPTHNGNPASGYAAGNYLASLSFSHAGK
jgi:PKD repeat protein